MNTLKYFVIAGCLLVLAACSKSLEKEPLERIHEDLVFDEMDKNADFAQQFLHGIYIQLPGGYNRVGGNFLDAGTDDAVSSQDGAAIENFRNGRITSLNVVDNVWDLNYTGIRRANMFLSKIDRVPTTSELKTQWKAEARFLRAYFYFELIKRWGGVPLIGDKIFGINDNLNLARNSLDECIQYILLELTAIEGDLLPLKVEDKDWGRAYKGAAMALRSRVLLYAASPLMNPGDDASKWMEAADAAKAIISSNNYSLVSDFTGLFNATRNAEIIFLKEQSQSQNVEINNGPVGYITGSGITSPSQNLVDAFPMKSGKPIFEADAGYDAANPYENRDPRLNATIMYNGKQWLSRPVETFEGGLDKPGGNRVQTKTGYYLRKFMGKFENSGNYSNQNHHILLFRYAEILLNYAEALNEASGPSQEVYDVLIAIRKRAGIEAGADNMYGLPAGIDKNEMRKIIHSERRVELAFEEHRFWDIRRWKTAEIVMNLPVKGVVIEKDDAGEFSFEIVEVVPSTFDASKMYWFPIPYSEVQTNPNMQQNPGWSY